jgi:transcriptional regulator with XRE-family HTH domain
MSISARYGVGYVPFLLCSLIRLTFRLPKRKLLVLATVGDHLRARRQVLSLTQAEAAEQIGVVRDALAKWESNLRQPGYRSVPSIICFLGYDPRPPAATFAELIGRTRRALGMSQPQLAEALGVPTPSLG